MAWPPVPSLPSHVSRQSRPPRLSRNRRLQQMCRIRMYPMWGCVKAPNVLVLSGKRVQRGTSNGRGLHDTLAAND